MGRYDLALHKKKKGPSIFDEAMKVITSKKRKPETASDSTAQDGLFDVRQTTVQPLGQPVGLSYAMRVLYSDTGVQGSTGIRGYMGVMGTTGLQGVTGYQGTTGIPWGYNTYTGIAPAGHSDSTGNHQYASGGIVYGNNPVVGGSDTTNEGAWFDPYDFRVTDGIPHRNGPTDTGRFSGSERNEARGPSGTNLLIGCPNGHRAIVPMRYVEASLDDQRRLVLRIPNPERVVEDIRAFKEGKRSENTLEARTRRGRFEVALGKELK